MSRHARHRSVDRQRRRRNDRHSSESDEYFQAPLVVKPVASPVRDSGTYRSPDLKKYKHTKKEKTPSESSDDSSEGSSDESSSGSGTEESGSDSSSGSESGSESGSSSSPASDEKGAKNGRQSAKANPPKNEDKKERAGERRPRDRSDDSIDRGSRKDRPPLNGGGDDGRKDGRDSSRVEVEQRGNRLSKRKSSVSPDRPRERRKHSRQGSTESRPRPEPKREPEPRRRSPRREENHRPDRRDSDRARRSPGRNDRSRKSPKRERSPMPDRARRSPRDRRGSPPMESRNRSPRRNSPAREESRRKSPRPRSPPRRDQRDHRDKRRSPLDAAGDRREKSRDSLTKAKSRDDFLSANEIKREPLSPSDRKDTRPERPRNKRDRLDEMKRRTREMEDAEKESKWGKKEDHVKEEEIRPEDKQKPDMGLSGKLAEDTNLFNGIVVKYNEPREAKKPKRRWRLYVFKGEESLPFIPLHRQSGYLMGRDRKVADIPVEHPSCSKQHAVLQYRSMPYDRADGTKGRRVRPYIIDLESSNGTFVNNKKIEPRRYFELFEKDVLKFGFSSREYVLLPEDASDQQDDGSPEEPAEAAAEAS